MEVIGVPKKEQKLSQAAVAISIITQKDIRRSGAANIPDLVRMARGMHVAQMNANTWAISLRRFSSEFANNLLVLVDGRAAYPPLFGGASGDMNAYFVVRLANQAVPSQIRLDTQPSLKISETGTLNAVGQNLLRDHHLEFNDFLQAVNSSQNKRSAN